MRFILPFILMIVILTSSTAVFAADNELNLAKYQGLKEIINNSENPDDLMNALKDAGDNWESLAQALVSVSGQKLEDLIWQIRVMPHLDRLEATSEILLEHLEYSYKAKEEFEYKIPDDMFRQYILVYRIYREPVTKWRKLIYDRFKDMAGTTPSETAKNVNEWVAENLKEREDGMFGPSLAPDQVLKIGLGNKSDIATLTTAILKTLGVPSRSARCTYFGQQKGGETWVEIYDGENWIPLYPDDASYFGDFNRWEKGKPHNITVVATTSAFDALQITPSYTETGRIQIKVIRRGVVQENFQHMGITVYNDGGWLPLDDLGFNLEESRLETNEENVFEAIVGDGTYVVQAGVRQRDGSVFFYTKEVSVNPGDVIPLDINLDPPIGQLKRKDLVVRELDEMPEWELPLFEHDGEITSKIAYLSRYSVIVMFDINTEPTQRMIPTLADLDEYKGNKIKVWGIHAGPVDAEKLHKFIDENNIEFPITIDETGEVVEAYGVPRQKDDETHFRRMPSIMLLYRGEVLLWQEGFDLGIKQYILDMIDYQEELPW